ncbi:transposase [Burkholderia ubonensis]|uniref:transposase n=1 Tax=Burkholderia ubonensis TaxID=101571 RepID=UPI000B196447|nr:transposase [Burkholderia ubonensis]
MAGIMQLNEFTQIIKKCDIRNKHIIRKALEDLSSNESLLSNHLKKIIRKNGFSFDDSMHNGYTFDLFRCKHFTVRLIFWAPVSSRDEKENFIYGLHHSHDFELHAIGYSGDGYRTIKTEILDLSPINNGEAPVIGRKEEIKLTKGTYFFMRPFLDIHQQLPPKKLSSSLSLLIHTKKGGNENQRAWCFDSDYAPTYSAVGDQEASIFNEIASLIDGCDNRS